MVAFPNTHALPYFFLFFPYGIYWLLTYYVIYMFMFVVYFLSPLLKYKELERRRFLCFVYGLSYSIWAVVTEYHRLGSLNGRHSFLMVLEAGKSKMTAVEDSVPSEGQFPGS